MSHNSEPAEMDDEELYVSYQRAKKSGPVERIDELQLEIAERWEEQLEDKHDGNVWEEFTDGEGPELL